MKNNLKILLISIYILFISCSKDDDNTTIVQEYFPTKIETSNPSDPNSNGNLTIQYDNQNKISQLSYGNGPNTILLEVTYNSDDLIALIKSTKTTPTSSTHLNFNFNYTNNVISQVILFNATNATALPITYTSSTKKYTIEDGTIPSNYFTYDDDDNLKEFVNGLSVSINYNGKKGIYKHIDNSFPLFYASLLSGFEGTMIYSQLFSNKEMINMQFSSGELATIITRNNANNISKIEYKNTATNEVEYTSIIEYQLRTVN